MRRFDVYQTIALIRRRPAMCIGSHSLPLLRSFLDGCCYVAHEHGIERGEQPDFGGLHDRVAKRFGWYESTAGWCNRIVQEYGADQSKALNRFFGMVEEYHQSAEQANAADWGR